MPVRPIEERFVRCPRDKPELDASWQFAMHPEIYHICKRCGVEVHHERPRVGPNAHEIRRATTRRRPGESWAAAFDRLTTSPTEYFTSPDNS